MIIMLGSRSVQMQLFWALGGGREGESGIGGILKAQKMVVRRKGALPWRMQ